MSYPSWTPEDLNLMRLSQPEIARLKSAKLAAYEAFVAAQCQQVKIQQIRYGYAPIYTQYSMS